MSMSLYTVDPAQEAVLKFCKMKVCPCSNGSLGVELDFLIQNTGSAPLNRLRVALPFRLTKSTFPLIFLGNQESRKGKLMEWISDTRPADLKEAALDQNSFTGHARSNWAYEECRYLEVDEISNGGEVFSLKRTTRGRDVLNGKLNEWKIEASPISNFAWALLWLNEFTILDMVADTDGDSIPPLASLPETDRDASCGWFRLRFVAPPQIKNEVGILSEFFSTSREYKHQIMSSAAVDDFLRDGINRFGNKLPEKFEFLKVTIRKAIGEIRTLIGGSKRISQEKDVRVFCYGKHSGIELSNPAWEGPEPYSPPRNEHASLPSAAFHWHKRNGILQRIKSFLKFHWLFWMFFPKRTVRCTEHWYGQDHPETSGVHQYLCRLHWKVRVTSGIELFTMTVNATRLTVALIAIWELILFGVRK